MADLEAAVRKLRTAQAGIPRAEERAARLVADARARLDQARAELAEAIRNEAAAGTRQRDIVEVTGYSRERIRQIIRDGEE
ncbi:hypothetical protein ACN27G_33490 [Plantactinospora sp. WMMB334]|uniref:hypothetical protein n=1 Tax=Plantactinospora sp. WMMB334 TaxID=3404119 RepID=UPI003B958403